MGERGYRPPARKETLVARFCYQHRRDRTSDVMSPLKAEETIFGESSILFRYIRSIRDMLMFEHSSVRNALTNNIERSPTLASCKRDCTIPFCSFKPRPHQQHVEATCRTATGNLWYSTFDMSKETEHVQCVLTC